MSSRTYISLVNRKEAAEAIRFAASAGRIRFERHARQRMRERGVYREDVRNALTYLETCQPAKDERWKVAGPDLDGDTLSVLVAIEGDLAVITVY
jgi:hypothetical protein